MNAVQGTVRLIYEDARWFLGKLLLLYITLPLTAVWIIIGISSDSGEASSFIGGPAYFFFVPFYAILGFKSLLPIAVGLGSTRTQLLKIFLTVGISAVFTVMLFLNICQWLLWTLYERGVSSASISHPGTLYSNEFMFLPYLWIDLMLALVLFGGAFFIYCITYRLGMTRTLIGTMIIGILALFLYYSGVIETPMQWIAKLKINAITAFTLVGVAGIGALLATYPMMRNASLVPKGKKE
ncbi:hypothetical protein I6N90_06845 [Paenibacillus sp. GSMTC-2017]|uniref:hypothetical protein n=1 Tax=Paenibacillus sp. GSMTC-2017 TaxID=2794350 RepID=UPI0018D76FCF|nr:hypothetical protein [Paenibacillus sp. GSMTC-2017]MBH5317533.1 hypothetical protein [Paenibacillus sp. GSMTC-2017]